MAKIVVGVSGASGSKLAYRLLAALKEAKVETYLVVSGSAITTWNYEMDIPIEKLYALADHVLDNMDIAACIASGSFKSDGMIIVPCSMKSIAGIAHGYSDNLLLRAADVMIKEKRTLVLCFRENPLSPIHIQNLQLLASIHNVYLMPMVMSYYQKPKTIEDMEHNLIGKMLEPFAIEYESYKRWS